MLQKRILNFCAAEKMAVTISPGVTTGELMSFFLKHDVCFEADVILPTVTYGGVFSGGCHVSVYVRKLGSVTVQLLSPLLIRSLPRFLEIHFYIGYWKRSEKHE